MRKWRDRNRKSGEKERMRKWRYGNRKSGEKRE